MEHKTASTEQTRHCIDCILKYFLNNQFHLVVHTHQIHCILISDLHNPHKPQM